MWNKSINCLSLQEEKGGLFSACEKCEGIVRFRSGWSAVLCVLSTGQTSWVSHGSLQASFGKSKRQKSVCAGAGAGCEGCHVLFWCKPVLYSNDLSGKQTENGSNKEPLPSKQRENGHFYMPYVRTLSNAFIRAVKNIA